MDEEDALLLVNLAIFLLIAVIVAAAYFIL